MGGFDTDDGGWDYGDNSDVVAVVFVGVVTLLILDSIMVTIMMTKWY